MKILISPDKFKGSLSSHEVCDAVEKGILNSLSKAQIKKIPLADGGEGSLEVLENTINFERKYVKVNNPLFQTIEAFYGLDGSTAYIEMAAASGLQLLNENERKPMLTTSFGTGELIRDAIEHGVKKIFLFIGGSATNDAGMGIASALGYDFRDKHNNLLEPIGKNLIKINRIGNESTLDFSDIKVTVLTDVFNALFGENGAAYVFASQKGASESEIIELDNGLRNISEIIKKYLGKDISKIPGSGAAGGVGGGVVAFCDAKIQSGIETILDLLSIDQEILTSDLIITGEGLFDKQTLEGKAVKGVMNRCEKLGKPLGILCGDSTLFEVELKQIYCSSLKPIKVDGISKEDAMVNAYEHLVQRSEELIKEFLAEST